MEDKIKVLWLDDAFVPDSSDTLLLRLDKFMQTDFSKLFEITRCANANDFKVYFASKKYDAVILDVFGFLEADYNNKTATKGFKSALEVVKNDFCIKIVYTGETYNREEELREYIFNDAKNIGFEVFSKMEISIPQLLKKIHLGCDDLFLKECPTIRKIWNMESLTKSAREYLQDVRQEFNEVIGGGKEPTQKGLNSMRYCVETIIRDDVVKNNIVKLEKIPQLGECMYKLYGKQQCPVLVGQSLIYLLNLANKLDHEDETRKETFEGYGPMMFRAIYYAFFTCVEWYYKTFKAKKENQLSINVNKDSNTCEPNRYTQLRLSAGKKFVGVIAGEKKKYIKYSSLHVAIETNDADAFPVGSNVAFVAQSRPNNKNPDKDYWFTTDVKLKEK